MGNHRGNLKLLLMLVLATVMAGCSKQNLSELLSGQNSSSSSSLPTTPNQSSFPPADIMDMDLTGASAVYAWIYPGNMGGGTYGDWPTYANKFDGGGNNPDCLLEYSPTNTCWLIDPANGMHYMHTGIGTGINNLRAINWAETFGIEVNNTANIPVRDDIFVAYSIRINPDVMTGMNPELLGAKLSGPYTNTGSAWIAEHSLRQPEITDSVALNDYGYSAEGAQATYWLANPNVGAAEMSTIGSAARAPVNMWFTIEMYLKLNTPGQSDGVKKIWLDNKLVFQRTDVNFRGSNAAERINGVQWQIYHGGAYNSTLRPLHYDIARLRISSQRIGLPKELTR